MNKQPIKRYFYMMHREKLIPLSNCNIDEKICLLYVEYNAELLHYVHLKIGSMEDAHDIIQEIFLKAWQKRNQIMVVESVKYYLFAIAQNCIKDYFRNKAKHRCVLQHYRFIGVTHNDPILEKEIKIVWHEAIERLPQRQREVYLLKEEEALNRKSIAHVLQISKNTVDVHLSYSQKKVRAYIGQKMKIGNQKKDIELAA